MAIDLSNRPKKERIVEMLQKRYRRKEIARRIPCSITYVNVIAKQAAARGIHFDPPKRRVGIKCKKEDHRRLSVRVSKKLHLQIYRAAQLALGAGQEPADLIREALEAWSRRVIEDAGQVVLPKTLPAIQRFVLEERHKDFKTTCYDAQSYPSVDEMTRDLLGQFPICCDYRQEEGEGEANNG